MTVECERQSVVSVDLRLVSVLLFSYSFFSAWITVVKFGGFISLVGPRAAV